MCVWGVGMRVESPLPWAQSNLALIGVLRCWFWCLQQWCYLLLGIRFWASPPPLRPPSALLRSLCTPANTRLITPLSIGPSCTLKGKEVLSSPSLFCHPFPLLYPFIICSLFSVPFLLHQHPTWCYFLSICVSVQRDFKKLELKWSMNL